jgi:5-methylcytosine-specific restriction protein A
LPNRIPSICGAFRCANPAVYGRGKCADHLRQYERERAPEARFYHTAEWKQTRTRFLLSNPLCEQSGCAEPSSEVDHRVRLRDGGDSSWGNLAAFCKPHHSAKTMRDRISKTKRTAIESTSGNQPRKIARFEPEKLVRKTVYEWGP